MKNISKKLLNYRDACNYIKKKLMDALGPNLISIVIFGSYAMLVPSVDSDIDLLLIVKERNSDTEDIVRGFSVDFAFTYGRSISPIILSTDDVEKSIQAMDPIIIAIFWAHDILFDKERWFEKQMTTLQNKILSQKDEIKMKRGAMVWTKEDLKILQESIMRQGKQS